MSQDAFSQWANRFRRDAVKDGMRLLRKHLQRIGLPDEPEKLIDGTIMYMSGCCAYLKIDGRAIGEFLAMQSYRPTLDADSHYSFTFNLFGLTFGRIITPLDMKCLDLADLHDHPWFDFKTCGYYDFRVARLDDKALSGDEIEDIEKEITYDIFFDYTEEDVDIWFDRDTIDGVLIVYVHDIFPEDQEP
ncbi:MAG: hypothetical protein GX811_02415 [Lentisphaerae bacterium]|nr:hypothetical protein [Lentisphaerota bacterium]